MNRIVRIAGLLTMTLLVACSVASAQRWGKKPPRVSYVFPGGARQGETVEITIGGQYLDKTEKIRVSGAGVTTSLIDYIRPPRQKDIANIREIFQRTQKKYLAENKGKKRRLGWRLAMYRMFVKTAKAEGVTDKQLASFKRYREQRNDPKRQVNPQLTESVKVKFTVAADAEPGLRELRLTTPIGLSNVLRFRIGKLPECREREPNDKMSAATRVPSLPMVLNGQIMPGDVDRFRFKATKGQQLVAKVYARDLIPYLADSVPGWFQATVTLYDADGREVAYADDYRFDPDPVLLFDVPRDGDYVLEIRDAIYRGREDFVYRITLGELPFVSSIFPLGARKGEKITVAVEGWNLPRKYLRLDLSDAETGPRPVRVAGKPYPSNELLFAVDDLPEMLEKEPNNSATRASNVKLPLIVNGRIDKPDDWDVFRFRARKGEKIVAEVRARRLGSPLDSFLKLTDASGKVLVFNDDCVDKGCGLVTHHADSKVSVVIPATGDYLLWLGDTQRKGGKEYGYRLRVSRSQPDFELRIVPSSVNGRGGTLVPVTVFALRRDGFSGDINLRLKDAPEGFKLDGGWVPAGQDECTMTLKLPAKPAQKMTALKMEGYATVDGREIRRTAVPADDVVQAFVYHHLVPVENWTAVVTPSRWGGPGWALMGASPVRLKAGTTTQVRVRGRVGRGRKIVLELVNPPAGITVQSVTPGMGRITATIHVDSEKAKPGLKGNLIINAFTEFKPKKKDGTVSTRTRRWLMGALPAIPFEVVGE